MWWVGFLMAATLALPVAAEEMTATTQAYGRIVSFPLPAGFAAATEREANGSYILEFLPEGETVDDWSQMITLSAARGVAQEVGTPLEMGLRIGDGFQAACPTTFWGSDEGVQPVDGAEAAHLLAFSCGDAGSGQSETALILVALSGEDVFTLQWAARGPAVDEPLRPEPGLWQVRGVPVLGLRLCPVKLGEAPPYPSCLD